VNEAAKAVWTTIVLVVVFDPELFETVKVTVFDPAVEYT